MIFSPLEWPRVALVRPELRETILAVGSEWEQEFPGEKLTVPMHGGWRAEGVQSVIYADSIANGFRAAPPGESPHELGAGIDLKIVGVPQNAEKDQQDPRYRRLAEIAVKHGLRAGFFFTRGKPDPYDFTMNESLDVMRAKWEGLKKKGSQLVSSSPSSLS